MAIYNPTERGLEWILTSQPSEGTNSANPWFQSSNFLIWDNKSLLLNALKLYFVTAAENNNSYFIFFLNNLDFVWELVICLHLMEEMHNEKCVKTLSMKQENKKL